jgi:hypothetical protein
MTRSLIVCVAAIVSALSSHTCVGAIDEVIERDRATLIYLLPTTANELIGGMTSKVAARIELSPSAVEAVEYRLCLWVNGCAYDPFVVTLLPGASGSVIATWHVCVTAPDFTTQVQLTARGKASGKSYGSDEVRRAFNVTAVLICRNHPSCSSEPLESRNIVRWRCRRFLNRIR